MCVKMLSKSDKIQSIKNCKTALIKFRNLKLIKYNKLRTGLITSKCICYSLVKIESYIHRNILLIRNYTT